MEVHSHPAENNKKTTEHVAINAHHTLWLWQSDCGKDTLMLYDYGYLALAPCMLMKLVDYV